MSISGGLGVTWLNSFVTISSTLILVIILFDFDLNSDFGINSFKQFKIHIEFGIFFFFKN